MPQIQLKQLLSLVMPCDTIMPECSLGHQHIGWTLAAVTGKTINELVKGNKPNYNIEPFSPERFN